MKDMFIEERKEALSRLDELKNIVSSSSQLVLFDEETIYDWYYSDAMFQDKDWRSKSHFNSIDYDPEEDARQDELQAEWEENLQENEEEGLDIY